MLSDEFESDARGVTVGRLADQHLRLEVIGEDGLVASLELHSHDAGEVGVRQTPASKHRRYLRSGRKSSLFMTISFQLSRAGIEAELRLTSARSHCTAAPVGLRNDARRSWNV